MKDERLFTLASLPLLVAAAWGAFASPPAWVVPLVWIAALWLPGAFVRKRGDLSAWDRAALPFAIGPVVFGGGVCLGRLAGLPLEQAALATIVLAFLAGLVPGRKAPPEAPRAHVWIPLVAGAAILLLGALPSLLHEPLRLRDDARLHLPIVQRILAGELPPGNPFLAGEPLAYFWFYHAVLAGVASLGKALPLDLVPAVFNAIALFALLSGVDRLARSLGLPPGARALALAFTGLGFSPIGWIRLLVLQATRPDIHWALVDASGASGLFPILCPEDPRLVAPLTKIAISNALPMSLALLAFAAALPSRASASVRARQAILTAGCLLFHVATGVLLAAGLAVRWIAARRGARRDETLRPAAGLGELAALAAGIASTIPYLASLLEARAAGAARLGIRLAEGAELHLPLLGLWLLALPALLAWSRQPRHRATLALGLPALVLPFAAHLVDGNEYKSLFFLLVLLAPAAGLGLARLTRRIPWAALLVIALFVPTPFLAARAYLREIPPGHLDPATRQALSEVSALLPEDAVLWKADPGRGYSALTVELGRPFFLSDPYALQILGQWDGEEARRRRTILDAARAGKAREAIRASMEDVPGRPFVFVESDGDARSGRALETPLERLGAVPAGSVPSLGLRLWLLGPASPLKKP